VSVEADRRFGLRSPSFSRPARSWGVDRLDQAVNALDGQLTSASTGAGVTAYVVDTGIARGHAAFGGRAVSGANLAGAGPADDCNGHGTHVAGTIGGGLGLGVAPEVRLVAVKVLGCDGSGSVADVIAGVDWVSQDHRPGAPAVANMSLGGGVSATLDAAVRRSVTDGVVWTVAAGNDGADACSGSPSRVRSAIVVGATDQADRRAPWSDWGRCVDVFAPGVGILSAWLGGPTATRTLDGTSMAAPHVAGVAALYLSATPGASPARTAAALRRGARTGIVTDARSPHADLAAVVG
jgi:subtilisin family serine protease